MSEMIPSSMSLVTADAGPRWRRSRRWTVGLAAPLLLLAGLLAVLWGATPALAEDVKVGLGCGGYGHDSGRRRPCQPWRRRHDLRRHLH